MEIKLSLTIEEVNGVMQALGNMPYVQVAALVEKVRSQAVVIKRLFWRKDRKSVV